jgi:nitrite reductase/ring-hydroxylating ferredoxin subunit/uncharacterized membrane protein
MKSQASIKGHPLHPMLIVYPFAFLTGAFGFNLAAAASRSRDLHAVADRLVPAGIAAGLAAAVPGLIDYLTVVPPKSSANERATKHALLNTAGLGLFAVSWLLSTRRDARRTALVLQGIGSAAMSVAGYMGGTLVYRNQIGVDHRYANAGKWQEESRGDAESQALTAAAAPLGVNQMKLVHADGRRIVVGRTETGYAAFDDRCTHRGGPLSDGALICGTVQCPWHGSQFDVHTGEVKCGPAEQPIETFPIDAPRLPESTPPA